MNTEEYRKLLQEKDSAYEKLKPWLVYSLHIENINEALNQGNIKKAKESLAFLATGLGKEMEFCKNDLLKSYEITEGIKEELNPFDQFAFVTYLEELKKK